MPTEAESFIVVHTSVKPSRTTGSSHKYTSMFRAASYRSIQAMTTLSSNWTPSPARTKMNTELEISFAEAHHVTQLIYPVPNLISGAYEEPWVMAPKHSETRYEPLPLIPNKVVTANSSTDSIEETAFFTISKADAESPEPLGSLDKHPRHGQLTRLMCDMFSLQGTPGQSTLSLMTFRNPHSRPISHHVRVLRSTRRRCWSGADEKSETTYQFSLSELISAVESREPVDAYLILSMHLIDRDSDLAVRHFNAQMRAWNYEDLSQFQWLERRAVDYAQALDALVISVKLKDLATDDTSCSICQNHYDNPESREGETLHRPVRLVSCGHIFGLSCIEAWVQHTGDIDDETIGPKHATCPLDRGSLFPPPVTRSLQFGLLKGVYYGDSCYSDFENFERSVADLDSCQPADLDTQGSIQINAAVLKEGWNSLLQGALLEPETSTPFQMQPVHYPEMQQATIAIGQYLAHNDSQKRSFAALIKEVSESIDIELRREADMPRFRRFYIKGNPDGSGPTWSSSTQQAEVRPRFRAWVRRALNRMVRFQGCRPCNGCLGFHKHGLRTYYNVRDTPSTYFVV